MRKRNDLGFTASFLAPTMIIFCLLIVVPVFMTSWYALSNWKGAGEIHFNGLGNFLKLLRDRNFATSVRNSFTLMFLALGIQLSFGLGMAFVVSRTKVGYKFFRGVYFLPSIIPATAIAILFVNFFNADVGVFNVMLRAIGLGELTKGAGWLSNPKTAIYFVAIPQVWQYMGQQFIIFLAAMQSLPEDMFESATIDGANSWTMFFRIALPNLKDVMEIVIVLIITGCLKAFDHSWIMTWGGPGYASSYIAVMMYKEVFKNSNFGYGSAIAISILAMSLTLVVVFKALTLFMRRNEDRAGDIQ